MGFDLKKLKNLFFVSEGETENKTQKNVTPPLVEEKKTVTTSTKQSEPVKIVSQNISHQQTISPPVTNQTASKGTFNQKIYDSLMAALAAANLPGEDYLEFAEALQAMKDIPLDEGIKIQTVFATLSVKGLTMQKVIESADYYLKLLENEKQKFYEAARLQTQNAVGKRQGELNEIEKSIQTKSQQIVSLTEEINRLQQEMIKIRTEAAEAEEKIKNTENSFLVAFEMVTNQIRNNIDRILFLKK